MDKDELMEYLNDDISEKYGDWIDEEVLQVTVEELKKYEQLG